jgi:hypothetical protein
MEKICKIEIGKHYYFNIRFDAEINDVVLSNANLVKCYFNIINSGHIQVIKYHYLYDKDYNFVSSIVHDIIKNKEYYLLVLCTKNIKFYKQIYTL